jgi:hypothetical protein
MDLDVYAKQGSNGPGSLKLIRLYECMRDVLGVVAIHNWGGTSLIFTAFCRRQLENLRFTAARTMPGSAR